MKHVKIVGFPFLLMFLALVVWRCGGGSDGGGGQSGVGEVTQGLITFRGRVDDGLAMSPIANAWCRFIQRDGSQLATATADLNGEFHFETSPALQGWLVCSPAGFPNLALTTFISTVGG